MEGLLLKTRNKYVDVYSGKWLIGTVEYGTKHVTATTIYSDKAQEFDNSVDALTLINEKHEEFINYHINLRNEDNGQ
jgi:hypothetical protein